MQNVCTFENINCSQHIIYKKLKIPYSDYYNTQKEALSFMKNYATMHT
jgi:hypothetical protein